MKFFVSGYNKMSCGIALLTVDEAGVNAIPMDTGTPDPSWVLPNRERTVLYSVSEDVKDGSVVAFDITPQGLTKKSERKSQGGAPCHLALSEDERFLYCSNYATGSVSVFPVTGSEILPCAQLVEHGEGANAHSVTLNPKDHRAYVCDLGLDTVFVYDRNAETGLLTERERLSLPEGAGPRHMVFDGGDRMYVACELRSLIVYFERVNGKWIRKQVLSTLPEDAGKSAVSAVRLADGCVYVANRGNDTVAVFAILPDGSLERKEFLPTGASFPRDFRILCGRVYACNQFGGVVTENGRPIYEMPGVSCITETLD